MRNKNMMIMGIVMILCQVMVFGAVGILFALDYLSTIMIAKSTAALIIGGTFLVLMNILSFGLIIFGMSE